MLSIKDRFINLGVLVGVGALATVFANVGLFSEALGGSPIGLALGPGLAALLGGGLQFLIDLLKKEEKVG